MNFRLTMKGDDVLGAKLIAKSIEADAKVAGAVKLYGALLVAGVRRHASGRPGPDVVTGDYRDSIAVRYEYALGGHRAIVYSNKPQARRLELGFIGTDSLGRQYHQPPFPHFRPAIKELEPLFVSGILAVAK